MSLKVVGAGLGRTATHSQKIALETLLGEPCYHMVEVFQHPEDVPVWHAAALDQPVDWVDLMDGYGAAVDWPASAFWPELAEANPDAIILLSLRDPEKWWKSAHETIFAKMPSHSDEPNPWLEMIKAMFASRFGGDITDKDSCISAFNRHNQKVVDTAPKDRLLVWRVEDGYAPICDALGLVAPESPFPLTNTTEEFLSRKNKVEDNETETLELV